MVDSVHSASAFPTQHGDFDDQAKARRVSDELVVFEGAQALPLFLIYYRARLGESGAGSITVAAKEEMLSEESSAPSQGLINWPFGFLCLCHIIVPLCCFD